MPYPALPPETPPAITAISPTDSISARSTEPAGSRHPTQIGAQPPAVQRPTASATTATAGSSDQIIPRRSPTNLSEFTRTSAPSRAALLGVPAVTSQLSNQPRPVPAAKQINPQTQEFAAVHQALDSLLLDSLPAPEMNANALAFPRANASRPTTKVGGQTSVPVKLPSIPSVPGAAFRVNRGRGAIAQTTNPAPEQEIQPSFSPSVPSDRQSAPTESTPEELKIQPASVPETPVLPASDTPPQPATPFPPSGAPAGDILRPSTTNAPTDSTAPTDRPPASGSEPPTPAQKPDNSGQPTPASTGQPTVPSGQGRPGSNAPSATPVSVQDVLELKSDRQEFDEQRRIFTAEGNVVMRFRNGVLDADRLQVNLVNNIAVAEGNVALTRGQQVLRGEQFRYNFVQGTGTVLRASGDIFLPSSGSDFNPTLPTDVSTGAILRPPLSDRVTANQPQQNVSSSGGRTNIIGSERAFPSAPYPLTSGGDVRRLRFQAEQVEFTPDGWEATNVRITNDPFSPPELELRTRRAKLTRLSPLRDEVITRNPRLVFDQGLSIPLFRSRTIIDRRRREPGLVQFGYDEGDRGGLFVQRSFEPISNERIRLVLTPQYYIQKSFSENGGSPFDPSLFGLKAQLNATLSPTTSVQGSAVLRTLDLNEQRDTLRASLRARQMIGTHTLALEYSYRDRLFNGSLGFQRVQSSFGAVLTSPTIQLGQSGIFLSYQAAVQNIEAETDRIDLLEPIRSNNRVNLTRYQASAALSRGFLLWQGKPLPATASQGLRYTPNPVVPYVSIGTGIQGVLSGYSSRDSQEFLIGSVSLYGQFGHFSRPFLDYTAFNITYARGIQGGNSPFLFDRTVDDQVLSLGISQQLYGPFRAGVQTSINLNSGKEITTDYILEYSRRTYSILLRYNPVLELGSIGFRLNDFNWTGGADPFPGSDVQFVQGGVTRDRDD